VSSVTVYFRDLRYGLGIILQLGLFATPVAYSFYQAVPEKYQALYSAINPLGPVIQSYRDTVLLGLPPKLDLLTIAFFSSLVWAVGGWVVFKRLEHGFSDVA
jgi:ABC-2 type transport system permease protein/lipopolysaccharide transport system permease protein